MLIENSKNVFVYGCSLYSRGGQCIYLRGDSDTAHTNILIDSCHIEHADEVTNNLRASIFITSDPALKNCKINNCHFKAVRNGIRIDHDGDVDLHNLK